MKGNVDSKFLIYLTKAKFELQAMVELTETKGITLHDELDVSISIRKIDDVLKWLTVGCDNKYKNVDMNKGVVNNIVRTMADMNSLIDCFDSIGINVDCDRFDGHLYGTISALSKALDYLCEISVDDDVSHLPVDTVSHSNYMTVADSLYKKHALAILDNINAIRENW